MKRSALLLGAFWFCFILSGCSSDAQGDAVGNVVQLMQGAAGDIELVTREVDSAVNKFQKDKTPLDLGEAIKMTKKLEETGKKAQEAKVKQIDRVKVADTEEKDELAAKFKGRINDAFSALMKAKKNLGEALQKAEAIDRDKTEELRTKIREAEGPFETLARQG